ncbi:MAG: sulfite exporter TauE/SafE family protein [Patescibacteria group bacterium]
MAKNRKVKEVVFGVGGIHCASCELVIEKRLLEEKGIKAVEVSAGNKELRIEYLGAGLPLSRLNQIFADQGYSFFDLKTEEGGGSGLDFRELFSAGLIGFLLIAIFLLLGRTGFNSLLNVNAQSALPAFFVFGLLAGVSTCAALVGGIVLSMSSQWLSLYGQQESTLTKLQPHFLFNGGRLLAFAIWGFLLGSLGSALQISLTATSLLAIAVSVLMLFLSLQMLGVGMFNRFRLGTPKLLTRLVADETNFKGKLMPFLMGMATLLLPCGFTITVQSLALLSGDPWQGFLIMSSFALGTLLPLLGIGLSNIKLSKDPHLSGQFLKVAGILVFFFALYNINSQLNILGIKSVGDFFVSAGSESALPPMVDGKQLIKMDASASGYRPNSFVVKVGVPVRWEITDTGTSGCTNAVISRDLFGGQIDLVPGTVSVKEFTPQKVGRYKFSCWMGMVSGVIEVVDN